MIFALIKKQLTLMLRNRTELLLLLLLPMGLITILSFALGSVMNGDSEMTEIHIGIVQHESEQEQLARFFEEAGDTIPMKDQVRQSLENRLPVSVLINEVFEQQELKEFIQLTMIDSAHFEEARKSKTYDAIIEVPNGFTKQYLTSIVFDEIQPTFNVYLNEEETIASTIVQSIINHFQQQYSVFTEFGQNGLLTSNVEIPTTTIQSDIKTIAKQEKITSSTYYTFSMAVMFMLFIAATLANQAYIEKDSNIFDRFVLAQVTPFQYLVSIIVSTILLAMIQITALFIFAFILFGQTFENIVLYFIVTLCLALVVAGISAFLSSLNYRLNSADASNIFSSAIVAILAFFGGSYFNVSTLSPVLAKIGQWTPNGAALEGYLSIVQNGSFSEIQPVVWNLLILAVIFLVLAFVCFPKRGGIV